MPFAIRLMQPWWKAGAGVGGVGYLAISWSLGEGLRSLRQPHHCNKNGSYVYRLIRTAHLDDYPISNPISREKRIARHFLPPPPLAGPCLWSRRVGWGGDMCWRWARSRWGALPSLPSRAGKPQRDGRPLRDRRGGAVAQQGPGAAG